MVRLRHGWHVGRFSDNLLADGAQRHSVDTGKAFLFGEGRPFSEQMT